MVETAQSAIADLVVESTARLPALPSSLRYYDDFLDTYQSIRDLAASNVWLIKADGVTARIDFQRHPADFVFLMKHVAVIMLSSFDPLNVAWTINLVGELHSRLRTAFLEPMLVLAPWDMRDLWETRLSPNLAHYEGNALKGLLRALCQLRVGAWSTDYVDYISRFSVVPNDPYRVVRTGECFLPLSHQAQVIDHLDELVDLVTNRSETVLTITLRDACILLITFQHAFRPGQIARIRRADVRAHNTGAVHFSTVLTKKRRMQQRARVTRRIKREWCPLLVEYQKRRGALQIDAPKVPADSFFGLTPSQVGALVQKIMADITGVDWTATDLRHTAAQRLVDSGASHIAVSEFLGHSVIHTANIYFDTSPTQAQLVNQALAVSPVYSAVADVARTRTIDKSALLQLPADQQIGGAPHGIPITGIGGCKKGQSLCAKNPVLSCYTCINFMPLHDVNIHRQVAEDLRPVVLAFAGASRGNDTSPAYTQLRIMLTKADKVATDIERGETT